MSRTNIEEEDEKDKAFINLKEADNFMSRGELKRKLERLLIDFDKPEKNQDTGLTYVLIQSFHNHDWNELKNNSEMFIERAKYNSQY